MRKIRQLVVHVSDSCDSLDFGVKEIDRWHKEKGWKGVGYHYVIRRNGRIERGRPDAVVGAHAYKHNKRSLGICWVGQKIPTREQYNSLINLLAHLRNDYKIDLDEVKGHSELDAHRICPNLDMNRVRGDVLFADVNKAKEAVSYVPERSQIWEEVRKFNTDDD